MEFNSRLIIYFVLVVAGLGILVTVGGEIVSDQTHENPKSVDGAVLSSSGSKCLDSIEQNNSGWVHTVVHGEETLVTLNAIVVHERAETITVSTRDKMNEHVIDIETERADTQSRAPVSNGSCEVASEIDVATSIPVDYDRVIVTVDGHEVQNIERAGTVQRLYSLPSPIRVNQSS